MLVRGGGRGVRGGGSLFEGSRYIKVASSFLIFSEILLSCVGADAYRATSFKLQALTGVQAN